ncbi:MAG: diaminopimelate decarboxylase [Actinomycetota bacterium]|nr:diaminopimelate decarboxylase [Actinomycetota bacterium]
MGAPQLLHDLVVSLGSPLNVVLPEQLADNLAEFSAVHRRHHLGGRVCFAHKANRSSALVRRLSATTGSIDVASLPELQHALGAGFVPGRILATGPKNREFLWLSARCGATVAVDSVSELLDLATLVRQYELSPVRVLLRLSGFVSRAFTVTPRPSRFGIPLSDLDAVAELLDTLRDAVELHGVAYHLDSIGLAEKAIALQSCLQAMSALQRHGADPRVVDIGGGFGVDYLAEPAEWERWTSDLTSAVLGKRPPITWNGHGYGLRAENGTLRGALGLYPSHRAIAGPAYLDRLLATPAPDLGDRPLSTLLLEHLHELWTEPGRALVDQCGAVLTRVSEVREGPGGHHLVRLELNARNISAEEHGVLMDPVLFGSAGVVPGSAPSEAAGPPDEPCGVYLLGNLCLETDLITRRVVHLPRLPRVGDLLVFANTAGYLMDFSAGTPLRQPQARTVAAWREGERWRWCLDEEYWPTQVFPHGTGALE